MSLNPSKPTYCTIQLGHVFQIHHEIVHPSICNIQTSSLSFTSLLCFWLANMSSANEHAEKFACIYICMHRLQIRDQDVGRDIKVVFSHFCLYLLSYITNVKKVAIYLSLGQLKTEPSSLRSTSVTSSSISDFTERVTTEEEQNIPTTFAIGQLAITNTTVIPNESSRPTATLLHHKKTTVGSAVASHGTEKSGNYCLKRISKFSIEALMITSLIKKPKKHTLHHIFHWSTFHHNVNSVRVFHYSWVLVINNFY